MTDVKKCAKCVHYGVMYNDEPCRTCDGDSKYEYDVAFPERFSWMFKAALKNQEKPKEEGEIVTEEIKETEEKTETTTEVPVSEGAIKDSGQRRAFSTGAVRDMAAGKGDMLSMPWAGLLRLSVHYENGAKKYGRFNYQKGIPVSSFIDSALRHIAKYLAGWDDEDHLSAAAFNVLGALEMEEMHPDMCDVKTREGKRSFLYPKPEDLRDHLVRLIEEMNGETP